MLMCLDAVGLPELRRPLNMALFRLLCRCDGMTEMGLVTGTEQAALDQLVQGGILERSEEPHSPQSWQEYRFIDNRRVTTVAWGITGRCNARCRHCFMASDTGYRPQEFSWDQCERILSEIADCGVTNIMLTGGEPLLHPDFFRIVHEIKRLGMKVTRIYTNGFLLKEETLARMADENQQPEMVISFDGLGVHDWMRNVSGAETAALSAIRLCKDRGLKVRVAMNLNTETLDSAIPTARMLAGMGVDEMFMIRTTQTPKWLDQTRRTLTDDVYLEFQLKLVSTLLPEIRGGMAMRFFNGIRIAPETRAEDLARIWPVFLSEKIRNCAWCNKTAEGFFIASDGRVLPCDACEGATIAGGVLTSDNRVFERPLRDILNDSDYSRAMEIRVEDVLEQNPECRSCQWRERCHGGPCRPCGAADRAARAGSWNIDILAGFRDRDPVNCRFFRGGYYERLMQLLEEPV